MKKAVDEFARSHEVQLLELRIKQFVFRKNNIVNSINSQGS